MSELKERLERLKIFDKHSENDHLKIVLFAAVLYGFRIEKVFKPFPERFYRENTKEPDIKRLVNLRLSFIFSPFS